MTQYLLKVHLQTFLSVPVTEKCQKLSCDILVANERYCAKCAIYSIMFRSYVIIAVSTFNPLNPTGHVMHHHQFSIQQLYALTTLYLCVLYLSENKQ
jgi:hypothetical protein